MATRRPQHLRRPRPACKMVIKAVCDHVEDFQPVGKSIGE